MTADVKNMMTTFIQDRYVMVCGITDDTQPYVFTAWYVTQDAKTLYFKSRTESTHMKALIKHPTIAISVYDHTSTYDKKKGIQAVGKIERVTKLDEMVKVVGMYSKAFVGSGSKLTNVPELLSSYVKSTMYKISIEKIKMVDTSAGLEMLEYEPFV